LNQVLNLFFQFLAGRTIPFFLFSTMQSYHTFLEKKSIYNH